MKYMQRIFNEYHNNLEESKNKRNKLISYSNS